MNAIVMKLLAMTLAFSQVTTAPDSVRTHFDPVRDREEVVRLLRAGCGHVRKVFEIETLNLDDVIETALPEGQVPQIDIGGLKGIDFEAMRAAYRQFCKNEDGPSPLIDVSEVIVFYNNAAQDLPRAETLRAPELPAMSEVLDGSGAHFAEVHKADHRRVWVPLSAIPKVVQQAFLAAEDKRFFEHKGIDERGLMRAFINNLATPGRAQGGSTITQQVVKNVFVGADATYERKIREMLIANRLEKMLSKDRILELYMNSAYFGRGAYGVELAARAYFGKRADALTLGEGAVLAGLLKGPGYFNPDRHPERIQERLAYVLTRMQEDKVADAEQVALGRTALAGVVKHERLRRDFGFYYVDQVAREAKADAGIESLTSEPLTIRSTIHPRLQRAVEESFHEGLASFELSNGRARFDAPETNLAEQIKRLEAQGKPLGKPLWQVALEGARLPLYDVHWSTAIVLEKVAGEERAAPRRNRDGKTTSRRRDQAKRPAATERIMVGLTDGRIMPLATYGKDPRRKLQVHDVVYVRVGVAKAKGKQAPRAELRVRPQVQGAVVVLENKTGRVLAMVGGFSYPLSQLNRATRALRQPGSLLKPFVYATALSKGGLQPNTLVRDEPVALPPVAGWRFARPGDYWTPRNYDGSIAGVVTLRNGLEQSRNLATAHLLTGGIEADPAQSLQRVCEMTVELQIYKECAPFYPFVLGAQPARLFALAAAYAAIANEGLRPTPHTIESIQRGGQVIYQRKAAAMTAISAADPAAFYQIKSMLQGVLARGTARQLAAFAPYAAGKTGTSDDENDAWFIGFTNDVTIAVWVGYDNADGKRTLGRGQTGAKVAAPIFGSILQQAWVHHAPKAKLSLPSARAAPALAMRQVDPSSGEVTSGPSVPGIDEYLRVDRSGNPLNKQYALVGRADASAARERRASGDDLLARLGGDPGGRSAEPSRTLPERYGEQREGADPDQRVAPQPVYRAGNLLDVLSQSGTPSEQPGQVRSQPRGHIPVLPRQIEEDHPRIQRADPDYFFRSWRSN